MDLELTGKTAIVSGGASNIGKAIALSLAAEGANVVIADIDAEHAERVAKEAAGSTGTVEVARCDVTSRESSEQTAADVVDRHGSIDILVNNVGWAEHCFFIEKDWDMAEREMAINFWGSLYLTKAALPSMIEQDSGRVVCVASDAAKVGEKRESVYSAAKAGVIGFVRSLAREVGRYSITVNAVCPSMTVPKSDDDIGQFSMHFERDRPEELMARIVKLYPLGRVGEPDDVASMVTFLASARGGFVTGQSISVNGGFVLS